MDTKSVIPDGMLDAAFALFKKDGEHKWRDTGNGDCQCVYCGAIDCSSAGDASCLGVSCATVGLVLKAALRWLSENRTVYTSEDVCEQIDAYPNILPEMAKVMKDAIMRGDCPHAVRVSLKIAPVTMFRSTQQEAGKI